jgi:ABC-type oligopeptide transport system substrate-binding subunit
VRTRRGSDVNRRLWFLVAAVAAGASMLILAVSAGVASSKSKGGTMRLNMSSTDVDATDPTLAYGNISWQIEYATALKLYNYPDKPAPEGSRIQPEAAASFPLISKDGKTYTITVRKGFRFSDGKPVTAANFAYAINRALSPRMQSPVVPFISNIVGAQAVLDKKAKTVSGVNVRGNKLIIKLTQPDGGLLAKLGMMFFQAIKTDLPLNPKGVNVYPSAGPYYIASREVGRQIVLRKNPFYAGRRPANIDRFLIAVNTNPNQSLLQVRANQVDYDMGTLPPSAHADLARQYGVNKGQYQVHTLVETDYLALNTTRPTFRSVAMRKAANFAIDRPKFVRNFGAYAGQLTDQILPPGMGGFRDAKVYPLQGPDVAKAKRLAGGTCGKVSLWSTTDTIGQNQAQAVKYDLGQIGCDVNVRLFQGFQIFTAAGKKGAGFDAMIAGWQQDYPDPYDFIDVLLNGNNIQESNNNNFAYLNDRKLNAKMAAANKLVGDARYTRYGNLDIEITRNHAPWAAIDNRNQREFVSKRTGGYLFQPANAAADLNTFFLK